MKHRVTVEVETRKCFLGIPYKATEKKKVTVDGKTYRKMKKNRKNTGPTDEEILYCAMVELEEEMAGLFGE